MEEEWRPIPGFEGDYEVSNLGRVRTFKRPGPQRTRREIPLLVGGGLDTWGYWQVVLAKGGKRRTAKVHHLVLEAFVGPKPPGAQCRHKDGIKTNNVLENLQWGTVQENADDRVRHGHSCMEGTALSKLTRADVVRMRDQYAGGGETFVGLAKKFGVSAGLVFQIVKRKAWKHA